MPTTKEELATMLSKRDGVSYEDEYNYIMDVAADLEHAFYNGNLDLAEDILRTELSLEPDYLEIFIY